MALISALMQSEIVTADPDDTVGEVARRMSYHDIGAVLVVRDDAIIGVFSERDLLKRVIASGKDPAKTRILDVATEHVISVEVDTHIRDCAALLKEKKIRHLPVTDGGKPVGIVSARDFFEHVATGLERFIDQARYEDALAKGEDPYEQLGGSYGR